MVERLAESWNELAIRYAIVHGVDDYPRSIGRDLDILVSREDSPQLLSVTKSVMTEDGWVVVVPPNTWGERVVGFKGDVGLEIHTINELAWREVLLAEVPNAISPNKLLPRDPWASFAKQVLLPGFHGNLSKASANASSLNFTTEERTLVQQSLSNLLGVVEQSILDSLLAAPSDVLGGLLIDLQSRMVRNAWRHHPSKSFRRLVSQLRKRLASFVRPTGVTVRLEVGNDARVIEVLRQLQSVEIHSVFTDFVIRPRRSSGDRELASLAEAISAWWRRVVFDRALLGGQRVVVRVEPPFSLAAAEWINRVRAWLERSGPQPDAVLYVDGQPGRRHSGALSRSGADLDVLASDLLRAAIEAFTRKHSEKS